jgi:uncharacterized Zn-finger protein
MQRRRVLTLGRATAPSACVFSLGNSTYSARSVPLFLASPTQQESTRAIWGVVRKWITSDRNKISPGVFRPGYDDNPADLYEPTPAEELIHEVPPKVIHGSSAACDGGGGALGHPLIYINLDKPGPHDCGYCGLRFIKAEEHH